MSTGAYNGWLSRAELDGERISLKREMLRTFTYLPTISVLMIVSEPDEIWIKRSVSSALAQIYPYFELCVCDNASSRPHVAESLAEFATSEERVKVRFLKEPASQAEAYNQALSLATGEFVALMDVGDEFASYALFSIVDLLQSAEADIVYADEDSVDISERRSDPIFKPYWSPDLLLSTPYVGRPCVVRRDLVEEIGGFREGFEGSEEYDLMLRLSEKTALIQHVPRMLYHRRTYGEGLARSNEVRQPQRRVIEEALERRAGRKEIYGEVIKASGFDPRSSQPVYGVSRQPTISVVALVSDGETTCSARDLAKRSSCPVQEVLITGSGTPTSDEGVCGNTSQVEMVNATAGRATGEYLLFVRNYLKSSSTGWISGLLRQAQRPEVGAVGGKVLSGDGDVRSAGSYSRLSELSGELSDAATQDDSFPLLPVTSYQFNPCAVPLECMMIRRAVFEEAGRFDETLPVFYDIDLSFRLIERGLLNVYTPEVSVISSEIGLPSPNEKEIAYMWRRWWAMLARELYYRESPLEADYGRFEDELPLFLQVQSVGRIAK